jgi:hypothetical protein
MLKNEFVMDIKSAPDGWMDKYLENWDQLIWENLFSQYS